MTRHIAITILLVAANSSLPGCAWMRGWVGPRDPFAQSAPCLLGPNPSEAEVITYLNANTSRVTAWRAERASIRGRGDASTPVDLNADLTIEAPRNFRLRAGTLAGPEVDLGSNEDEFWFWNRRSEEKYVHVAYHDPESASGRELPIPFQPQWIMEALGVMPIDAATTTSQPGRPGTKTIVLISEQVSPQGRPVRKMTLVDTCHGIILKHDLVDEQGKLIASAQMSRHVRDPRTQAVLPTQIDLDWPKANVGLTLVMGQLDVNPQHLPQTIWQRPAKEGYPVNYLNH
jgi:hypothetical protein